MQKQIAAALLTACLAGTLLAQKQQPLAPHTNVAAYEEASAIEKLAYRASPYYVELSDAWEQRTTDSSTLYSYTLSAEKEWKDYHIRLYARCATACRLYVNKRQVAYGDDSRHWNAFLLDNHLKYGKENTLVIEVPRHSRGALVEAPAATPGLIGTPYLLFKSEPGIADFDIHADYDAAAKAGTLTLTAQIDAEAKKGRYYLELEVWNPDGRRLDRMGRWVIFSSDEAARGEISRSWNDVLPWTAETPNLYTAVLRLYDEDMQEQELTGTRFGFRRVEVKGGTLLVNSTPITFRGITYACDDAFGETSRSRMQHDVETLKQYNINAVRTSPTSPIDPYFYELCDRYGLYVVCDANLLPKSTRQTAVATDPAYEPLFTQRVRNLYGTYKNHASIVAWSLGNSRDNGVCMSAAYNEMKRIEKHRPVLFLGAGFAENTDLVALAFPTEQTLEKAVAKSGGRPLLFAPAADTLTLAQLAEVWPKVAPQRGIQGGFADLRTLDPRWLAALGNIYCPATVSLDKISLDEASFWVKNNNDFSDLSRFVVDYTVYTTMRPNVIDGELPVAAAAGERGKVSLRIPPVTVASGEELFVRLDVKRRFQGRPAAADGATSSYVFPIPQKSKRKSAFATSGAPLSLADTAKIDLPDILFEGHAGWKAETAASLVHQPDSHSLCCERVIHFTSHGKAVCDVHLLAVLYSTGDQLLSCSVNPLSSGNLPLKPYLLWTRQHRQARWFGTSSQSAVPASATILGFYDSDLATPCEGGQVRWCTLQEGDCTTLLHLIDATFQLSANRTTVALMPDNGDHFCLHSRKCAGEDYTALMSVAYPLPDSKIPAPPAIEPRESLFAQPVRVTLTAPRPYTIRYTLDGSIPDETSPTYTEPFSLTETTVVKARAYAPDGIASLTRTQKYSYNFVAATTFSRKPNTPYNIGADTLLFDRRQGTIDNLSDGWLGFSGEAVATTVKLSKPIAIDYVRLRYAHTPDTWVFAPQQVSVTFSTDGETFVDTLVVSVPFDPAQQKNVSPTVVDLTVPVKKSGYQYIRIMPATIKVLPEWHKAKGLKPWLLMDEIEVAELTTE